MDIPIKSPDDLMDFLASLHSKDNSPEYVTTRQICDTLNISEKKAVRLLRKAIEAGKVEYGRVYIRSIDGRTVPSSGYKLTAS